MQRIRSFNVTTDIVSMEAKGRSLTKVIQDGHLVKQAHYGRKFIAAVRDVCFTVNKKPSDVFDFVAVMLHVQL